MFIYAGVLEPTTVRNDGAISLRIDMAEVERFEKEAQDLEELAEAYQQSKSD